MNDTKTNRYSNVQNFVPSTVAQPPAVRRLTPQEAAQLAQQFQPDTTVYIDGAFHAQEGADEQTSGVDRSEALVIRFGPVERNLLLLVGGVFLLIAFALILTGEADARVTLIFAACGTAIVFACLSLHFYRKMDAQERYDSKHGVEHHRITAATELNREQMHLDHALRREIAQAYLKMLEENEHD